MFSEHVKLAGDVPPWALSRSTTACAPLATLLEISSRWSCIMSVSA